MVEKIGYIDGRKIILRVCSLEQKKRKQNEMR